MKTVILVGDSIRGGYQDTVRSELSDVADVRGAEQNGGNSRNVLDHLEEWVTSHDPDVVHLNCGLHDIRVDFGGSQRAVPVDEYERNVSQILTQLKTSTPAVIIWASSTPLNEKWHRETKPFDRLEADVSTYNAVAARIAGELGVPIHDLFAVVEQAGRDTLFLPDGVHFSDEGYDLLGKAVAAFIEAYL